MKGEKGLEEDRREGYGEGGGTSNITICVIAIFRALLLWSGSEKPNDIERMALWSYHV